MNYHNKCMETRSQFVASQVVRLLDEVAQKCADETWDGRELVTGLAMAFKQVCRGVGLGYDQALAMVRAIEAPALPRGVSLLVAPNGRPLDSPPAASPTRIVGGRVATYR